MSLILPGNVASAIGGGYEVANSCRFNDGDSAAMSKSSTTLTNDKKFTISAWVKRGALSGSGQFPIFGHISDSDNANKNCQFGFYNDALYMAYVDGGSVTMNKVTTALYRDIGAWYHVMVAVDSTQGTAANRNRFYVNGTEVTSFSTDTNVGSDETFLATSCTITVGKYSNTSGTASYFDGYLAEVVYIDGLQLTPTSFGEFDSDTPSVFKPIDVSGLTFGNNGFYLDFEDSSNLGNDANGGTDFTESNLAATDSSTDSPTNNFATLNPLKRLGNTNRLFEEGNLQFHTTSSSWGNTASTISFSKGKFYAEAKVMNLVSSDGYGSVGIVDINGSAYDGDDTVLKQDNATAGVCFDHRTGRSEIRVSGSAITSNIGDFSNNDILGFAVDMDNKALYVHLNGTYYQISSVTGVPTSGASKTGATTIPTSVVDCAFQVGSYTADADFAMNFGSPFFTISSGNSDANGYGNFEYAVPSGYYALCTKNLAEYG